MGQETEEKYLKNIRSYASKHYQNQPLSIWHRLPISRRSSVFILLFMGQLGELRVLLTKRSSKLRNFPGHISLPGGKADTGLESEWQVARREMEEEIGISINNEFLLKNYGFEIEHLNILPSYLSRTFSSVRPCIGFMKFTDADAINKQNIINLNPGESSSVFSCPLRDFLYPLIKDEPLESLERNSYKVKWGGIPWDLRTYTFLQSNDREVPWLKKIVDLSASEIESDEDQLELEEQLSGDDVKEVTSESIGSNIKTRQRKSTSKPKTKRVKKDLSSWGRLGSRRHEVTNEKIYDVWGLTANILHDLATIAYISEGDGSSIKREIGEEELIYSIFEHGKQMRVKQRSEEETKLIQAESLQEPFGFNDILPRTEFNRLKNLYKL
ncbi:putative peroxisomal coenzyme A diphosphatase peroxisomal precursor [Scheffersomyces amazonensis]|uniref:putative peroxisomal coenzyme A diphosphatase peroxisomal precursor n=1 Tax=Scheffersomyces amazonensis TaxID=1078765 RepID=UPI00315D0D3F